MKRKEKKLSTAENAPGRNVARKVTATRTAGRRHVLRNVI
jgi:hypothetical protein